MKKKMTYVAPETEQMEIKFEKDFLDGSMKVGDSSTASGVGGEGMDADDLAW